MTPERREAWYDALAELSEGWYDDLDIPEHVGLEWCRKARRAIAECHRGRRDASR